MMEIGDVTRHAVVSGLILSLYLGTAFVALSRLNPEMWLGDYPPDIQDRFGPMSGKARRQRLWLGLPVLLVAVVFVLAASVHLIRSGDGSPGYAVLYAHTFVVLMTFNVVDLVVIDWLLFVRIRPGFVVLPGTEGAAGYDDDRFHWIAFLKGTAGIAVASAILPALALLIA